MSNGKGKETGKVQRSAHTLKPAAQVKGGESWGTMSPPGDSEKKKPPIIDLEKMLAAHGKTPEDMGIDLSGADDASGGKVSDSGSPQQPQPEEIKMTTTPVMPNVADPDDAQPTKVERLSDLKDQAGLPEPAAQLTQMPEGPNEAMSVPIDQIVAAAASAMPDGEDVLPPGESTQTHNINHLMDLAGRTVQPKEVGTLPPPPDPEVTQAVAEALAKGDSSPEQSAQVVEALSRGDTGLPATQTPDPHEVDRDDGGGDMSNHGQDSPQDGVEKMASTEQIDDMSCEDVDTDCSSRDDRADDSSWEEGGELSSEQPPVLAKGYHDVDQFGISGVNVASGATKPAQERIARIVQALFAMALARYEVIRGKTTLMEIGKFDFEFAGWGLEPLQIHFNTQREELINGALTVLGSAFTRYESQHGLIVDELKGVHFDAPSIAEAIATVTQTAVAHLEATQAEETQGELIVGELRGTVESFKTLLGAVVIPKIESPAGMKGSDAMRQLQEQQRLAFEAQTRLLESMAQQNEFNLEQAELSLAPLLNARVFAEEELAAREAEEAATVWTLDQLHKFVTILEGSDGSDGVIETLKSEMLSLRAELDEAGISLEGVLTEMPHEVEIRRWNEHHHSVIAAVAHFYPNDERPCPALPVDQFAGLGDIGGLIKDRLKVFHGYRKDLEVYQGGYGVLEEGIRYLAGTRRGQLKGKEFNAISPEIAAALKALPPRAAYDLMMKAIVEKDGGPKLTDEERDLLPERLQKALEWIPKKLRFNNLVARDGKLSDAKNKAEGETVKAKEALDRNIEAGKETDKTLNKLDRDLIDTTKSLSIWKILGIVGIISVVLNIILVIALIM